MHEHKHNIKVCVLSSRGKASDIFVADGCKRMVSQQINDRRDSIVTTIL